MVGKPVPWNPDPSTMVDRTYRLIACLAVTGGRNALIEFHGTHFPTMNIPQLGQDELNELNQIISEHFVRYFQGHSVNMTDELQHELINKLAGIRVNDQSMSDDEVDQLCDWYNDTAVNIVSKLEDHIKAFKFVQ